MPSLWNFRSVLAGLLAAFAMVALLAAPGPARAADTFTGEQIEAVQTIIRDYLMQNPEVLRDALVELERRQAAEEDERRAKAIAENKDKLLNSEYQVVLGNPDGDVTLIEFFDYNCGYCKRALSDMMDLIKTDPKLRIVLKEFPVLGRESIEAAQVAIAVAEQNRYLDFHQKLMTSKGRNGREQALAAAAELGLDMDKLKADMESDKVADTISEVYALSNALAINGTPAYIIGDEIIEGAIGFAGLKEKIAAMRQCGETSC